jgi:polyferredoxin
MHAMSFASLVYLVVIAVIIRVYGVPFIFSEVECIDVSTDKFGFCFHIFSTANFATAAIKYLPSFHLSRGMLLVLLSGTVTFAVGHFIFRGLVRSCEEAESFIKTTTPTEHEELI